MLLKVHLQDIYQDVLALKIKYIKVLVSILSLVLFLSVWFKITRSAQIIVVINDKSESKH